jgi:nitrite reductase/ring-hydroxylating ferredoxin subunit
LKWLVLSKFPRRKENASKFVVSSSPFSISIGNCSPFMTAARIKKTAQLVRGILNGSGVKCPNHGYRFDLKTGKCDRGDEWNTPVYQVKIENETILVGPATL